MQQGHPSTSAPLSRSTAARHPVQNSVVFHFAPDSHGQLIRTHSSVWLLKGLDVGYREETLYYYFQY